MRILVACEYSATVRDAFRRRGHDAWSADLEPTDGDPAFHFQGDVLKLLGLGWDMMIAHPPCTHLAVSGARWFPLKQAEQAAALDFVRALLAAPIPRIALENPVSIISSVIRKPDQIVQPWMFGDEATKTTCLWLKGLPLLTPTRIVGKGARYTTPSGRSLPTWYNLPDSKGRAKKRSRTFAGIAEAMALQWPGDFCLTTDNAGPIV